MHLIALKVIIQVLYIDCLSSIIFLVIIIINKFLTLYYISMSLYRDLNCEVDSLHDINFNYIHRLDIQWTCVAMKK